MAGPRGSPTVPWECPWGHARARGHARQGPQLAGMWDADLQGAKPVRYEAGVLGFVLFYGHTVSSLALTTASSSQCHAAGNPGVPARHQAEGEAVPHISFASLSPDLPAGYTGCSCSAPEEGTEPPGSGAGEGLRPAGLH